ncbi:hypothetical protein BKG93_11630 [Rodentibacter ratti]|uniref:Uncharacterized protein n=1 Tax=Rodentibacter ratti TaxID=1906745 RepID=A0A1V3KWT4_9PAST|nr:hypothetical protein [Rodentibacter ratti]OOF81780.1 hypothetical protein BKG93_11630 [Rodentibacter ratti]
MPRNTKYILKTNGLGFTSKEKVGDHFKEIKSIAKANDGNFILDVNHINDVIDFIQDLHNDREIIQSEFNLDNCDFYIKKSQGYPTECIWIRDKETKQERQIATSKDSFGNPPTPRQNFLSFARKIIEEIKKENRKEKAIIEGKDYTQNDLWHLKPYLVDIVDEFIMENNLLDKLDQIISPNGSGSGVAYLVSNFELKEKFIEFYLEEERK